MLIIISDTAYFLQVSLFMAFKYIHELNVLIVLSQFYNTTVSIHFFMLMTNAKFQDLILLIMSSTHCAHALLNIMYLGQ